MPRLRRVNGHHDLKRSQDGFLLKDTQGSKLSKDGTSLEGSKILRFVAKIGKLLRIKRKEKDKKIPTRPASRSLPTIMEEPEQEDIQASYPPRPDNVGAVSTQHRDNAFTFGVPVLSSMLYTEASFSGEDRLSAHRRNGMGLEAPGLLVGTKTHPPDSRYLDATSTGSKHERRSRLTSTASTSTNQVSAQSSSTASTKRSETIEASAIIPVTSSDAFTHRYHGLILRNRSNSLSTCKLLDMSTLLRQAWEAHLVNARINVSTQFMVRVALAGVQEFVIALLNQMATQKAEFDVLKEDSEAAYRIAKDSHELEVEELRDNRTYALEDQGNEYEEKLSAMTKSRDRFRTKFYEETRKHRSTRDELMAQKSIARGSEREKEELQQQVHALTEERDAARREESRLRGALGRAIVSEQSYGAHQEQNRMLQKFGAESSFEGISYMWSEMGQMAAKIQRLENANNWLEQEAASAREEREIANAMYGAMERDLDVRYADEPRTRPYGEHATTRPDELKDAEQALEVSQHLSQKNLERVQTLEAQLCSLQDALEDTTAEKAKIEAPLRGIIEQKELEYQNLEAAHVDLSETVIAQAEVIRAYGASAHSIEKQVLHALVEKANVEIAHARMTILTMQDHLARQRAYAHPDRALEKEVKTLKDELETVKNENIELQDNLLRSEMDCNVAEQKAESTQKKMGKWQAELSQGSTDLANSISSLDEQAGLVYLVGHTAKLMHERARMEKKVSKLRRLVAEMNNKMTSMDWDMKNWSDYFRNMLITAESKLRERDLVVLENGQLRDFICHHGHMPIVKIEKVPRPAGEDLEFLDGAKTVLVNFFKCVPGSPPVKTSVDYDYEALREKLNHQPETEDLIDLRCPVGGCNMSIFKPPGFDSWLPKQTLLDGGTSEGEE